jgi:hypothetical protein
MLRSTRGLFGNAREKGQVMQQPPWLPVSASVLFVIALLALGSLGRAVGVTLAYLGIGLMIRFRREPPDLLKLISPGSQWQRATRGSQTSTGTRPWQLASLIAGVGLIVLGVTFFVLASES